MNLTTARDLALTLMHEHNLTGWHFQFDRARRRSGYCWYAMRTISLSRGYVELNDEALVRNTVLHEIAHALVGVGHHHDRVWRLKAMSIGCNGQRCTSAVGDSEVIRPRAPFEAVCPGCDRIYSAFRISRRGPKSCGVCDPTRFNERFVLVYRRVR